MTFHTSYAQAVARVVAALAATAALISCVKSSTFEKIKEIDTTGTHPMSFTNAGIVQQNSNTGTKASSSLQSGFMVSCWKTVDRAMSPVMADYKVDYKTSGTAWDGTTRAHWDYVGVTDWDGQEQYEKYWDLSAYPYRFHAIAPCPASRTGLTIASDAITLGVPYKGQKVVNGSVTPENSVAEPYLVAQVSRDNDGNDKDVFTNQTINAGTSSGTSRNRTVAMPFHHLNSKVRFGVYAAGEWVTAQHLYIKDLKINVTSANFVTEAGGYSATGSGSWRKDTGYSGFTSLTKATAPTTILQFDGGPSVEGNDLSLHQGKSSAYFLQCPDGIVQIPQENVEMKISLKVMNQDETTYKTYDNVPVKLEIDGGQYQTKYNWVSGYQYTYYLILVFDEKLEISFTCTLTQWDDISGSLSTDLEK